MKPPEPNYGQVCVAILLDNFITASADIQQVPLHFSFTAHALIETRFVTFA